MKIWQCTICKYIHKGDTPPEKCPICGVDASKFIEIDEADIPVKKPKRKIIASPVKAVASKKSLREKIEGLLCKYHAHPVSVHTPNGLIPIAVVLFILSWLFSSDLLAKVAVINLVFVIITLPVVIYTGVLEWKRKYNGVLTLIFKLKIFAASITSASCVLGVLWYVIDPNIIHSSKAMVFLLINMIMLAAAGVAGHIGGKLVFKD